MNKINILFKGKARIAHLVKIFNMLPDKKKWGGRGRIRRRRKKIGRGNWGERWRKSRKVQFCNDSEQIEKKIKGEEYQQGGAKKEVKYNTNNPTNISLNKLKLKFIFSFPPFSDNSIINVIFNIPLLLFNKNSPPKFK